MTDNKPGSKILFFILMVTSLWFVPFVSKSQKIFIDSLAEINTYLKIFHYDFSKTISHFSNEKYNIIIINKDHDPRYALPLPNAPDHLNIPTDDGSGQCVHPSVIDFLTEHNIPEWNGFRYWMAMTPHPFTNAKKENPNIVASNDGITWVVPPGIINPIDKITTDTVKENLADPDMIYNPDSNQLWLYYMHRNSTTDILATINLIKINKNLTHTKPVPVLIYRKNDSLTIVSPCIWRESRQKWHMWAVKLILPNYMVYMFSKDGIHWSKENLVMNKDGQCPVHEIGYRPWHISCKPNYREKRIEFMINGSRGAWETSPPYKTNLLLFAVADMKNPGQMRMPVNVPILFNPGEVHKWDYPIIYRTSFTINYKDNKCFYRLWYSAASYQYGTWYIGYTEGSIDTYYSYLTVSAPETYKNEIFIDSIYNSIRIYAYGTGGDTLKIMLFNRADNLVYSRKILSPVADLDISLLNPGIYLAIISFKKYKISRKLIRK